MKKIFKTLVLGTFAAMLMAVGSVSMFAQEGDVCNQFDEGAALYEIYTGNHAGAITRQSVNDKRKAVKAAKEFVDTYANCEQFKAQVDYLKKAGPSMDKKIDAMQVIWDEEDRRNRFDKAMKAGEPGEIFASGEDVLKHEPEFVDVAIVLATVGLDQATEKKVDTYNNQTLKYANLVINDLNKDVKSETGKYGAFGGAFEYETKENTLGWMNYTIGIVKYYRQKKEDEGIDYFYKAIQFDSEVKDKAFIYELVGIRFQNKVPVIIDEIKEIVRLNDGKDSYEAKLKFSLAKGFADRAIDALSRAYKFAKANPKANAGYADGLYKQLQSLYNFRFEIDGTKPGAEAETKTALDSLIASKTSSPMQNPDSEVKPVDPPIKEEPETKTEGTDTSTSTTKMEKKTETKTKGTDTSSMTKVEKKTEAKTDTAKPKN